ncbi:MAG: phospholipase [Dysgonamonadaceae bacterium]|jgi:hypothetical protein|nr:phospholipase [Dysgonamonadaceae bacterium]
MKLKNLFATDSPVSQISMEEGDAEFCCGKHAICKKSLPPRPSPNPVEYYDDEELDVFKGRSADTYTAKETEQFMEIFRTMWASDLPGWLTSLRLREIELPYSLQRYICS